MIEVSVKMMANYLNVSWNTAKKRYQVYKYILEVKRAKLYITDIAKIDGLEVSEVLSKMY